VALQERERRPPRPPPLGPPLLLRPPYTARAGSISTASRAGRLGRDPMAVGRFFRRGLRGGKGIS